MRVVKLKDIKSLINEELTPSLWVKINQDRINIFADATDDHQWIHVDPDKAKEQSPFKRTIAHGFLSLSMLSSLMKEVLQVEDISMGINYGFEKIRFPHPVRSGDQIRLKAKIDDVEKRDGKGIHVTWSCIVEIKDVEKPACTAIWNIMLMN
ncbi:MaoC family dehydratase [Marinigracilibium pacificum]|uniref:MaoC family dehydratase n=1 Tax=Marinigracilibium pacificum TaxID=2729599 RepID=A0A848JA75_9BACT|nr:MaoC family dehydratase [Marinigracilibium pacificum]NMM49942.1 MaoC family dehydratase [Marinigracilibium pacificum]